MTNVYCIYNSKAVSKLLIDSIEKEMPYHVADALTSDDPNGKLTYKDVNIKSSFAKEQNQTDHTLEFIVFSNPIPSMAKNIKERREHIEGIIKIFARWYQVHIVVRISIFLFPASFASFET